MDTLAVAFVVANFLVTLALAYLVVTKKSGDGALSGEVRSELRDATSVLRQDLGQQRTELHQVLESQRSTVEQRLTAIAESQHALSGSIDQRLEASALGVAELGATLGERHNEFSKHVNDAFETMRLTNEAKLEAVRATVGEKLEETLEKRLELVRKTLEERLDENAKRIAELSESNAQRQTELQKALGVELEKLRKDNEAKLEQVRQTVDEKLQETLDKRLVENRKALDERLDLNAKRITELSDSNSKRQSELQIVLREEMEKLRKDNEQKLEKMRETVDEKLQGTLEKRLGESFALVSDRLELVQKGLGEMQTLASDVGGLKRVLTNVKARGSWGEVQLSRQLEDVLTPDQYESNVAIKKNSQERVEFAIKLPGRDDDGRPVYLPIDSKFPQEDYERLLNAQDEGTKEATDAAGKALERAIIAQAKTIGDKYIDPPHSTDFAIMYLPTEGLFAEVTRRPGLTSRLQNEYRVLVTGPTTLMSLLNSLQMGFRTLAIEKRSSEVWQVLSAAKVEFNKYGQVWEKLGKQLATAQNTVSEAGRRTRAVERKLREVETPELGTSEALALEEIFDATDESAVAL